MTLRSVLGRSPTLRAGRDRVIRTRAQLATRLTRPINFEKLPPTKAVRLVYQIMLRRDPDPVGFADLVGGIATGRLTRREVVQAVRGSEEFQSTSGFTGRMLGHSIHSGRCQFIRTLPPAKRIVDLGGTHLHRDEGAMVGLGYPYHFDELVIVDLPSDERHAIYRSRDTGREVSSRLGRVRYRYHSMTDLSGFEDATVDLVYSGQSIEHVTPDDGATVLKEVFRILRPGGHLAVDTPNARVTRLQQDEFIDPDHKIEYTHQEMLSALEGAGFEVIETKGLNYAGASLAAGRFDIDEVAGNSGLYAAIDDCYILCYVCRKPEDDR
jgi:SAM-dependent methyltransferase